MPQERRIPIQELADETGVSYKSLQKAFHERGAPSRRDKVEALEFIKLRFAGGAKIPDDLAEQRILIDFETKKHRRDEKREAAEKLRLHNLEKKGQLVERNEVKAHGAAIGLLLSSTISGWVKDLPSILVGKSEREMGTIIKDKGDSLISAIRDSISKAVKIKGTGAD